MNITALLENFGRKLEEEKLWSNGLMASMLSAFISTYYGPRFMVFTLSCRNIKACNSFWELLAMTDLRTNITTFNIFYQREDKTERILGPRYQSVIMVDSYQAFLDLDIAWYMKNSDVNEFYYICLQVEDIHADYHIQHIFDYCWHHQLINCALQRQTDAGEVLIYTYFPFAQNHCNQVKPIIIGSYTGQGSFASLNIFPRKIRNMHGCPLFGAVYHSAPYIFLKKDEQGQLHIEKGFEGELILTLQRLLNFSVVVRLPPNDERRGKFIGEKMTGAIGMLHRREANFSLGAFLQTPDRSRILTSISAYHQTTMVLVILRSSFKLTSTEIFVHPFTSQLWVLVFIIHFGFLIGETMIRRCEGLDFDIIVGNLRLFALLLGYNMEWPVQTASARWRFATLLFYALLIRCSYSALIYNLLQPDLTLPMPLSIEQLVERGYTLVVNEVVFDAIKHLPIVDRMLHIVISGAADTASFEYILAAPPTQLLVNTMPLDFLYYYGYQKLKSGVIYMLPYGIFEMPMTIFLSKHSFLKDEFERQIGWISSAGLLEYWRNIDQQNGSMPIDTPGEDLGFNLRLLAFPFALLLGGLGISIMCFFVELLLHRLKRRGTT